MTSPRVRAMLVMLVSVALMVIAAPVSGAQEANAGLGVANGRAKDAVIVGFEEGTSKVKRGRAAKSVDAKSARKLSPLAADIYVVKLPPGQTVEKAIAKLERQDGVEFAEPDYIVQTAETSNDELFADLWGMHGDASTPSNEFGSGAAEAWAVGAIGDPGVYVAVLDEGINTNHEDLAANMDVARGRDFLSGDTDVYDGPSYWHGTHVAGTIGARGGNAIGVAGVNWQVKMISVKMLGPEDNSGYISETVAALDYVTSLKDAGLNIVAINASWGYQGGPSTALYEAIQRAGDAGLLFVAAAGNNDKDIDKSQFTFYPASYDCSTTAAGTPRGWDCIISVANLTEFGEMASTSNYGAANVDLGAPGSSILSTYSASYAYSGGTSMAAPHVTGAAALCASLDPGASAAVIRDRILASTVTTTSMVKTVTGGRLDVGALAIACGPPAPVAVPSLVGSDKDAAALALTTAGLVGDPSAVNSASPLDEVISQDPAATTLVAPGSTVSYVYSLGPAPVAVPSLVGSDKDAAALALTTAGLVGDPSAVNSASPLDEVISQDPAATTLVAPGATVSYVYSLGPAPVAIAPTPSTVIVDNKSSRFVRRGIGWRAAKIGYAKHSFWVPVRKSSVRRVALWRPLLTAPGRYRVLAKVPGRIATTKRAAYQIRTASGWVKRVRNQNKYRGKWVDLGVHALTSRPVVRLNDRTGEGAKSGRRVAFDAMRFVPVGSSVTPSAATPPSSAEQLAPASDLSPTPGPVATPDPAPKATLQPAVEPEATEKSIPKPAADVVVEQTSPSAAIPTQQPKATTEPTPVPEPTPEPTVAPAVKAKSEPKAIAAPTAKTTPKTPPKPKPTPKLAPKLKPTPEPTPAPELVLKVDPVELEIGVGESSATAAYVCVKGLGGAGPDGEYATADDSCSRAKDAEWITKGPAIVSLERPGEEKDHRVVLTATAPAGATQVVAKVGALRASLKLTIISSEPETPPEAEG